MIGRNEREGLNYTRYGLFNAKVGRLYPMWYKSKIIDNSIVNKIFE